MEDLEALVVSWGTSHKWKSAAVQLAVWFIYDRNQTDVCTYMLRKTIKFKSLMQVGYI